MFKNIERINEINIGVFMISTWRQCWCWAKNGMELGCSILEYRSDQKDIGLFRHSCPPFEHLMPSNVGTTSGNQKGTSVLRRVKIVLDRFYSIEWLGQRSDNVMFVHIPGLFSKVCESYISNIMEIANECIHTKFRRLELINGRK